MRQHMALLLSTHCVFKSVLCRLLTCKTRTYANEQSVFWKAAGPNSGFLCCWMGLSEGWRELDVDRLLSSTALSAVPYSRLGLSTLSPCWSLQLEQVTALHLCSSPRGVLCKHKGFIQTLDGSACLRRISIRNGPITWEVLHFPLTARSMLLCCGANGGETCSVLMGVKWEEDQHYRARLSALSAGNKRNRRSEDQSLQYRVWSQSPSIQDNSGSMAAEGKTTGWSGHGLRGAQRSTVWFYWQPFLYSFIKIFLQGSSKKSLQRLSDSAETKLF